MTHSGLAYNTSHLPDQQLLVEDQAHLSPESDVHILCDRVTLNGASWNASRGHIEARHQRPCSPQTAVVKL